MPCLGEGKMNDISNYCTVEFKSNGKQITVMYPDEFDEWYIGLIASFLNVCYKRGKKNLKIILVVGKPKNEETGEYTINTNSMVGGARGEFIFLIISKKLFSSLKQTRLCCRMSESIYILVNYLYHELHHIKGNRGEPEISEKIFTKIIHEFWIDYTYYPDDEKNDNYKKFKEDLNE